MLVLKSRQLVRVDWFIVTGKRTPPGGNTVSPNFILERLGSIWRRGKGQKWLGSTSSERTRGFRSGLALRKSQKSKILFLLWNVTSETKRQRLRGRSSRQVSENLQIVLVDEWPTILSRTSQGSRGDG